MSSFGLLSELVSQTSIVRVGLMKNIDGLAIPLDLPWLTSHNAISSSATLRVPAPVPATPASHPPLRLLLSQYQPTYRPTVVQTVYAPVLTLGGRVVTARSRVLSPRADPISAAPRGRLLSVGSKALAAPESKHQMVTLHPSPNTAGRRPGPTCGSVQIYTSTLPENS